MQARFPMRCRFYPIAASPSLRLDHLHDHDGSGSEADADGQLRRQAPPCCARPLSDDYTTAAVAASVPLSDFVGIASIHKVTLLSIIPPLQLLASYPAKAERCDPVGSSPWTPYRPLEKSTAPQQLPSHEASHQRQADLSSGACQ